MIPRDACEKIERLNEEAGELYIWLSTCANRAIQSEKSGYTTWAGPTPG